jgi:hypothetical protein
MVFVASFCWLLHAAISRAEEMIKLNLVFERIRDIEVLFLVVIDNK